MGFNGDLMVINDEFNDDFMVIQWHLMMILMGME